jgi:predicted DCC family thiol-disulfide oxidoreductase YuxK
MKESIILYYDEICPFCNNYAQVLKLKEQFKIELKDINISTDEIASLSKDINIEDGFIVVYRNTYYQGARALQFLDSVVEKRTFLGKLHFLFKYDNFFSNTLYKILLILRKIALFIKR